MHTKKSPFRFPEAPVLPPFQRAKVKSHLRYEDICQDGRVTTHALPYTMGPAVWTALLATHPLSTAAARDGIVPILTRLLIEGGDGPLSVIKPLEMEGSFQLAHTVNEAEEVNRLILINRVQLYGQAGHRHPELARPGERIFAGRVFGEHVFSRLFAPPEARKVVRLELDGQPMVPADRYDWSPPEALLEMPEGAEPLEPAISPDEVPMVFGLSHTDSNQHVNSLVYPRLFEEAVLRRFDRLGLNGRLLSRFVEVAYRKPCFAGDRMRILVRAFRYEGALCALGAFIPDAEAGSAEAIAAARPHCFLQMRFSS